MLENSTIVVAHPDDEVLWMSSVLDKVNEIVICFIDFPPIPALGKGRQRVIAEYPLDNISSLDIEESESFDCADWPQPEVNRVGLQLTGNRKTERKYQKNYFILYDLLSEKLCGVKNVFTHNPWGEYGHEDHVQVYRVVRDLQEKLDFNLWFPNYCSKRSAGLLAVHLSELSIDHATFNTNVELGKKITELYQKNKCWTWPGEYEWAKEETFYNRNNDIECNTTNSAYSFPLNMITTEVSGRPTRRQGGYNILHKKFYRILRRR